MAECREGGGTHIDPGNHPALPGLLRHLSELLPPVHHLTLAPPTSSLPPQPLSSTAPPSLSRATFCVPAMLRCRVFMSSSSPGVKTADLRQVRCTPNERELLHPISFLKRKLDERDARFVAKTIRLPLRVLAAPAVKTFRHRPSDKVRQDRTMIKRVFFIILSLYYFDIIFFAENFLRSITGVQCDFPKSLDFS